MIKYINSQYIKQINFFNFNRAKICWWHKHFCWMTRKQQDTEKWKSTADKKRQKTKETPDYLRARGYTVVEMWECQYHTKLNSDKRMKDFVDSRQPPPLNEKLPRPKYYRPSWTTNYLEWSKSTSGYLNNGHRTSSIQP